MYPIAIMLPPLSLLADWTQPGTLSPVLPPTPVKRFKYRIYPHPQQKQALARAFGCARVVWNDALALRQEAWKRRERVSGNDAVKLCITQAKGASERAWLAGVGNIACNGPSGIWIRHSATGGGA